MMRSILVAAFVAFAAAPASAIGAGDAASRLAKPAPLNVIDIQMRRDGKPNSYDRKPNRYDNRNYNRLRYKHRYKPGSRLDRPPPNWRRYGSRPRDWSTRGCIVVGPIWFCP